MRWRSLAAVASVAGGMAVLPVVTALPAAGYPTTDVVLQGHGWGGGFGMGQWGALGYAVDGYSYQQIVSQYYGTLANGGATTLGPLPNNWTDTGTMVTAGINENAGNDVIVTSGSPFTVTWMGGSASVPANGGAEFALTSASAKTWTVATNSGGGQNGACGGGSGGWAPVATGVSAPWAVPGNEPFPGDANLASEVIQVCIVGGNISLRGMVGGAVNSAGQSRTIDNLPLQQYLADVVPAESPTSWGTLQSSDPAGAGPPSGTPSGEGWGFQELEAQAIAARSYLMSTYGTGDYGGYADICDTTQCQDYPGIADENATTDAAVTGTANQVVLEGSTVEQTQYSASTGGYTAPGLFAAVADAGDAVCISGACNPHHNWSASIPVSSVEAAYPQIGTLVSVDISQRNGYGDYGGRVEEMTIQGTSGSQTTTGDDFAAQFAGDGVQSNWFTVENQANDGEVGYWVAGTDGGIFNFGSAGYHGSMGGHHLNAPIVGMAATPDGGGYWEVATDGGIFNFGDAAFAGSMGGHHLNAPIVGMAAMPDGGGYWQVATDGGIFNFGEAAFAGSMGGSHLNAPIVGMAVDPAGGYWMVASDGGIFSFGGAKFYGSTGGQHLNAPIVAMAATPDGGGYWLVASDGGVFTFGDAIYEGSLPGDGISAKAVTLFSDKTGQGYDIATAGGQVVAFGDAPQFGEPAASSPTDLMVSAAADLS